MISFGGKSCDLLFSDELKLFAPEFLQEEIDKHKEEILNKSGLAEVELDLVLSLIFLRIIFVPFSEFDRHLETAIRICPDPGDTEYFSLALKHKCLIWSNDRELKQQEVIKVYNTQEMISLRLED